MSDDIFLLGSDLPKPVISELRINKAEQQIIDLLTIAGRELSLNELLIGLYRKFNVQEKRHKLNARMYRLCKSGMVESAHKGHYRLCKLTEPGE